MKQRLIRLLLLVFICFQNLSVCNAQKMFASFHVGSEYSLVSGALQDYPGIANIQFGGSVNDDLLFRGGINSSLSWFSKNHSYIELEGGLAYKIYSDGFFADVFLMGNLILGSASYIYDDIGSETIVMFAPGIMPSFYLNDHMVFELPLYFFRGNTNSGIVSGLRFFAGIRYEF